jgi:hypothetical protein
MPGIRIEKEGRTSQSINFSVGFALAGTYERQPSATDSLEGQ